LILALASKHFTPGAALYRRTDNTMDAPVKFLPVLGRFLLALIFVQGGIHKLGVIGATATEMAGHGIPLSNILVWGAVAMELGGGLMLMTGLFTRWAALALCLYTLTLALIFHAYWAVPEAAARTQHAAFFNHIAMMGGMLYVVAFGAGPYSLDALVWRRPTTLAAAE
jgi:putative oxidoreductase